MFKKFTLFSCFIFIVTVCSAQKASLKGVIEDTTAKQKLVNTTIALLRAKDSTLYKYTRSKTGGTFEIDDIDTGKYVFMVTHNRYADYMDEFPITSGETKDLGNIPMTLEANLLADVTVRTRIAAMRMRGDTLEYTADSFHVRQGASVEDLLKVLPGIQVDKNGNITAQGEKVQKIMVDGEEFFGDDPTVATQNLQADALQSVQVFDKKSDQAEFTGIDDGEKTKTINLKLKEDKKKGYFGKLEVGGGTDERWNNNAMINNFKGKKRISAYAIMSNTGKTGLGWDEQSSYGSGGGGMSFDDDFGGFVINSSNDEFTSGNYYGEGVPKSWAAGINFGNKFNDDKQNFNGSYRFNKISTTSDGNTFSQSVLPDSMFYNKQSSTSFNSRYRHSLSTIYEQQFDSSFSLKFTGSGYTGHQNIYSDFLSQALDANGALVNQSKRNTNSNGDNSNLNLNLLLRKKFKKQGRTISLNISDVYNKSNTDGFLYSLNSFYSKGNMIYQDTTDQEKINDAKINVFNTKIVYTEPIIKNLYAEFNYAFRLSTNHAENLSYDKALDGKYSVLSDSFSTRYNFDVTTNTGGASLKYNGKKLTLGVGTDIASTDFRQEDLFKDTLFKRNYLNFFPKANFTYKFNSQSRINIRYNGSSSQPTIQQISPVADNTNPLVITKGNPDLKQQFRHNININTNSFKMLSQSGFFLYSGINITSNAIVTNQYTDTNGITTYTYVNTNGNYNMYGGINFFRKFKKGNFNLNYGLNYNASKYSNFVNGKKNETNNYNPGFNIGFNKGKEKKYDINYNFDFGYNISKSSINTSLSTKYWTQDHRLDLTVYLPWKLEFNNSVDANLRQKTVVFNTNNNVILWNAYIGRKLFKNDKGLIKFSVYDLLDQNKGYDRQLNTNTITENNYNSINRYFMLSFIWNFSKTAAGMPNQGQSVSGRF
ncbi:MAG: TonB-dependent receptor family protein [Bacteroidetes bacterium]|nr:TonB-dependent receptor family protein [Bacteroidota bacterium]